MLAGDYLGPNTLVSYTSSQVSHVIITNLAQSIAYSAAEAVLGSLL